MLKQTFKYLYEICKQYLSREKKGKNQENPFLSLSECFPFLYNVEATCRVLIPLLLDKYCIMGTS